MNLEKVIENAISWIRQHQERFWAVVGVFVLSVALCVMVWRHHETEKAEAWNRLGIIQSQLMQNQYDTARKSMDEWMQRFNRSDAGVYGQFIKADLLFRTSDYVAAAELYGEIAQTGRPAEMRPLALSAQTSSEEMAGHGPQAQALAQSFLERYPDHFLTADMFLTQARLTESAGNPSAASAIYDRYLILYPQNPRAAFAKAKAQLLKVTAK